MSNNTLSNHNPYVQTVPVPVNGHGSGTSDNGAMGKLCDALNRCGKRFEDASRKAEIYLDNVWQHFRVSRSFSDAAMARIAQGAKVLTEGGYDRVFQQTFETLPGEKLLEAYVCYISTSNGPLSGTLYLSSKKVAFASDHPFRYYTPTGQQWMYYKVILPLDRMRSVNNSSNRVDPSEKHIQIETTDGHEFWFLGFISYDRALKQLREASQWSRNPSRQIQIS